MPAGDDADPHRDDIERRDGPSRRRRLQTLEQVIELSDFGADMVSAFNQDNRLTHAPPAVVDAGFGDGQRPGRCTRSHGHSAASQAATASASGPSISAWLARTHDWTVTSAS